MLINKFVGHFPLLGLFDFRKIARGPRLETAVFQPDNYAVMSRALPLATNYRRISDDCALFSQIINSRKILGNFFFILQNIAIISLLGEKGLVFDRNVLLIKPRRTCVHFLCSTCTVHVYSQWRCPTPTSADHSRQQLARSGRMQKTSRQALLNSFMGSDSVG